MNKKDRSERKRRVYIAMSGGVDSSVAAALLKKQGHGVVGVFMKPWQPKGTICLWEKDREDALRAAAVIGIPFKTWDFSREYKKSVTDYMIREYKAGRTPNPDVMCNKEIKFGLFFKKALKEGADHIATGHYVRLRRHNPNIRMNTNAPNSRHSDKFIDSHYELMQAKDKNKDQSYFLWTLTPEQLKYCLFPIGDYLKPDVRKLAKKFGLPNHAKKDSQGVCFIGPLDMKEFLKKYIKPKKGKIIYLPIRTNRPIDNRAGKMMGSHDGIYYYTIGQRHGLDIKAGAGPYYVIGKDIKNNIIYVGDDASAISDSAKISDINWISPVNLPAKFDVRVRYRAPLHKAMLSKDGKLKFSKPERAVTSGQSAVFYSRGQLIGGGIIL